MMADTFVGEVNNNECAICWHQAIDREPSGLRATQTRYRDPPARVYRGSAAIGVARTNVVTADDERNRTQWCCDPRGRFGWRALWRGQSLRRPI